MFNHDWRIMKRFTGSIERENRKDEANWCLVLDRLSQLLS